MQSVETAPTAPSASDYHKGIAAIRERFLAAVSVAFTKAVADHETLVSSIFRKRLDARLDAPIVEDGAGSAADASDIATPAKQTARMITIQVLADAATPIGYAPIVAAIIGAGMSKAAADKARTRLIKDSAIAVERGLYRLTDEGRRLSAGSG